MNRQISADRIRNLFCGTWVPNEVDNPQDWAIRELSRQMSIQMLEKMFEFNKIKIIKQDTHTLYVADIEVIVPTKSYIP